MIETMLLSAGLPVLLDLIKSAGGAVSRKWFGMSVDDEIKYDNAQVEKLKALAALDNPFGTPSQWVIDLRGAFRYVFSGALVFAGTAVALYGCYKDFADFIEVGMQLATAPMAFILGERMVLSLRGIAR